MVAMDDPGNNLETRTPIASDASAKTAWWTWAWHPLLFAVFPVLSLFNVNLAEVPAGEVVRPLLVMLAAAGLLWGLLALVLRNAHKAALFSTLTLLLFFLYGNLRGLLRQSASPLLADCGRDDAFLLRPLVGLLLLAFILLLGTKRDLRGWTGPLNAAGAFLVLWPLFGIGKTVVPLFFKPAPAAATVTAKTAIPPEQLPDIYYIILDAYAREDTLQRVFHYYNRPFLAHLEEQGFYVARESRANYCQTHMSLPSSLNMAYLDTLVPARDAEGRRAQLAARFDDNAVMRELRGQGYRIVALPFEASLNLPSADLRTPFPEEDAAAVTEFEVMLLSLTPLKLPSSLAQEQTLNPYELHRRRIKFQLEQLPAAADGPGPTFVFAHILCPHPPFVLHRKVGEDPDLTHYTQDGGFYGVGGGTLEEYLSEYPVQLDCLNRMVTKSVDRLLKHARRPTVIILQSDHGSGAYTDWRHPERIDVRERAFNLCAIYTPDGPLPDLYPGITPVNIFRVLFNHYLHTDYPRLPDRSYLAYPGKQIQFPTP